MRFDRPVGTLLLLWPTLAALWVAGETPPSLLVVCIFIVGTFVMRAAGCVVNDIADRKFDAHVRRTQNRPLVDGRLSVGQALVCFAVLGLIAFLLVLMLNTLTRWMALIGIAIAVIYPFMKRFTHLPQLVLGVAFSWGIVMAGTAVAETITTSIGLLFAMSFLWIVAYDTQYAMVDREDDIGIGIKSSAILFGERDLLVIAILQALSWLVLLLLGWIANMRYFYFAAVLLIGGFFAYQIFLIRDREESNCFRAFKNNVWVGFALFCGVILEHAPYDLLS